ncbi:hypothetical protein [Actinomadura sp. CNU-125]|uniref:hypothetical protein n=1 Tax=Actinomadura sp. CNU-125 TaxID=1904961 RepID=UPI00117878CD|nr:hypothetical protein [Actinomadura sp. CNU-125]
MWTTIGQGLRGGRAAKHGLSVFLIAVSSLYFILCLPSLHGERSAHLDGATTASPSASASHIHGPAGTVHQDAAADHLPHAPHGDCEHSITLSPDFSRLALLLFTILLLWGSSSGAFCRLHLLYALDALRRRRGRCRPLSGIRLLNVLCLARL